MGHEADTRLALVLGGTGKTGRRVVDRLRARNVPVRVGSRSAELPFDWGDRSTWAPVLRGTSSVYVSYFPDLAAPGASASIGAFTRLALDAGTQRLVLLSGRGETEAERCEQVVQGSRANWTIVRCSIFMQNFSESFLLGPVLAGDIVFPADGIPEPFIDADDIADVAVAALTEDGHAGQLYELTGPRLLTFAEAVEAIAQASGRQLRYTPVSLNDYAAALKGQDLPDDFVEVLRQVLSEILDGRNAKLTDGVHRALGREPRDFAEYTRVAAATGVWNV